MEGPKRSRSSLSLYQIVNLGLESGDPISGLIWIEVNKEFALNKEKFISWYQKFGNTTYKSENIINRMTKSKSGFILVDRTPPPGYDRVCTHVLWNGKPNPVPVQTFNTPAVSTYVYLPAGVTHKQSGNSPPRQNVSVPPVPDQEENILDNIFSSEIIPVTLLKRQPNEINVWQSYQFSIPHFIDELRALPNLFMNDFDKINFEILLPAETGTQTNFMPTDALREFGIRFGSWMRIVEKVRDFVTDGAKDWFFGKCDGALATQILSQYPNDKEYYFIRSVPVDTKTVPDLKYVFAISYRKIGENIAHIRIYKDKLDRLCMITDGRTTQPFVNFSQIINTVLKNSPTPISNPLFKDLLKVPPQKIFTNDIKDKKDYERLGSKK